IRYSGSPIAMGFGEARQQKQVLLVQFGAVENDFSNQKPASNSTSESNMPKLTNTVTNIEQSVEKAAKKVASRSAGFIDDLFGFDDSVESEENTQKAFE